MNLDPKKAIGCIYLKFDSNNVMQKYRCMRIQNGDTVNLRNIETGTNIKVSVDNLKKDFILLEPDGYLFFSHVTMDKKEVDNPLMQDIIISFFRKADLLDVTPVPYCVCRQNINSPFDVIKNDVTQNVNIVGCSVSQETIPADMNFMVMLSCEDTIHNQVISIYFEDDLDTITSYRAVKYFDKQLDKIKYAFDLYRAVNMMIETFDGYCNSVSELMKYNEFLYDVRRGFNIAQLDYRIFKDLVDETKLDKNSLDQVQKLLGKTIRNHMVVDFDRDIDIELIRGDKIFVCDITGALYIISYEEDDGVQSMFPSLNLPV